MHFQAIFLKHTHITCSSRNFEWIITQSICTDLLSSASSSLTERNAIAINIDLLVHG